MNTSSPTTAAATIRTAAPELVSAPWTEQDEKFFRIVADVFAPSFLRGASVLLASYDPESDTA